MRLQTPDASPKLAQRLQRSTTASTAPGLGGTATVQGLAGTVAASSTYSQVVACAGSARLRVRIKTATATGTLNVKPIAPLAASPKDESAVAADGTIDPAKVTAYTTGTGTVSVSAGVEANVDLDLYGENHVLVEFVCTLDGTITYCDVSQV